jgi:hypothetical protein
MTDTTPADELRAAVEKLRTLTTDLGDCRGPWYVVNRAQRPYPQRIDNIGVPYVVASTTTDPGYPPTIADYIAAMHPGVGLAVADWLAEVADLHEPKLRGHGALVPPGCQWCEDEDWPCADTRRALAVARAINQQQPRETGQETT